MPPYSQNQNTNHISPNVFGHIIGGLRQVFAVNPLTTILSFAVSNLLIILTVNVLFFTVVVDFIETRATASYAKTALLIGCIAILCTIAIYAYLIVLYPIISSMYERKVTLGASLKRAFERLPSITLFWLIVGILYVVWVIVLTVLMELNAMAGVVGGSLLLAVIVGFLLRILYIPMLLMDDIPPEGFQAAFQRSVVLWKRSRAALLLYLFVIVMLVFGGVAAFSTASNSAADEKASAQVETTSEESSEGGDNTGPSEESSQEETQQQASSETSTDKGSVIAAFGGVIAVYSLITVIFSALVTIFMTSAVARMYQLARQLADGIDLAEEIEHSPAFTQGTWPIGPYAPPTPPQQDNLTYQAPPAPTPPPNNYYQAPPAQPQMPTLPSILYGPPQEQSQQQPTYTPPPAPSAPDTTPDFTPSLPPTPPSEPIAPLLEPDSTPPQLTTPPPAPTPNTIDNISSEQHQEIVQVIPHDDEPKQ